MMDHFEDVCFLFAAHEGVAHTAAANHGNWFNRGGFSKYYIGHSRTGWLHAMRDDVKAFVRTNFNMVALSLDSENCTFWEHGVAAAQDKTHVSGRFLEQVERGFVGFVVEQDAHTRVDRFIAKFVVVNVFPEASVGVVVEHCNAVGRCAEGRGIVPIEQAQNVHLGSRVRFK